MFTNIAIEYLTAVNGHHLLIQLVESYKILSTAVERGLLGTKQGADADLLIYPSPDTQEGDEGISSMEGGEISTDIIQLVETLGNIRVREAGVTSSSSAHPTMISGGKKKKKKKRGNKMMMVDMGYPPVDPASECVLAVGTETVFMTSSSTTTTTVATVATTTTTAAKTTAVDHNPTMINQTLCPHPNKGPVMNDGCRTIKDLVRQEQMSKPLRVHEYYKLWGIYELDVVY